MKQYEVGTLVVDGGLLGWWTFHTPRRGLGGGGAATRPGPSIPYHTGPPVA